MTLSCGLRIYCWLRMWREMEKLGLPLVRLLMWRTYVRSCMCWSSCCLLDGVRGKLLCVLILAPIAPAMLVLGFVLGCIAALELYWVGLQFLV